MKFKLVATSLVYGVIDNLDTVPTCPEKYIEKIKNADSSLELPEPVIEDHQVYIHLVYAS